MGIKTSKMNGFTLIELMVTIAVSAVLLTVAVPSFKEIISNNRTSTTANALVSALSYSRSEAIKRGISVSTRRKGSTASEWDSGWDVFVDVNGDGSLTSGTDTLLKTYEAIPNGYSLTTGGSFTNAITFEATGLLSGSVGDTFKLCNSDGIAAKAREIVVNSVGRLSTNTGTVSCP